MMVTRVVSMAIMMVVGRVVLRVIVRVQGKQRDRRGKQHRQRAAQGGRKEVLKCLEAAHRHPYCD